MKICLINNLFKLYEGKQKLYIDLLAEGLARENEVMVITTEVFSGLSSLRSSVVDYNGIKTYRFYPLNLYSHYPYRYRPLWLRVMWHLIDIWNPHSYFVIKGILEKEKPDVVHTMNLIGLSASVFTAVRAAGCWHVHTPTDGGLISPWANLSRNGGMISFNPLDRLYLRITRALVKSPDAVLALSRFMRDMYLGRGFFKGSPVYVIEYPCRLYPPARQGKSYSPMNILFVGNIVRDKGIYTLLDAFKKLGRNNVNLHFAGSGPELDNLKRLAQDTANVHVHGFVNDESLIELYRRANVTVVPSLCFEAGKAAAFLESLPFGTPVVASTAGGCAEGVVDGVNGRVFESGNSLMLRDILRDLIDNPARLKEMEREVLKSAESYHLEKCVRDMVSIYQEVKDASQS